MKITSRSVVSILVIILDVALLTVLYIRGYWYFLIPVSMVASFAVHWLNRNELAEDGENTNTVANKREAMMLKATKYLTALNCIIWILFLVFLIALFVCAKINNVR